MANYTLADVKALREQTGAGMMDVKNALVEAEGNYDEALKIIRMKGLKSLSKREGREASAGLVVAQVADDFKTGVMVEVNSETDFVAKNEKFIAFANEVLAAAAASGAADLETLLASPAGEGTVQDLVDAMGAQVGEKILVSRIARVEGDYVGLYLHKTSEDLPAQIGILVATDDKGEKVARDIAMHIAVFKPRWLDKDAIPAEVVEGERETLTAITLNEGKPEHIVPKIVEGRLSAFYKENTLLAQDYAKDPSVTVGKVLDAEGASVSEFVRFQVGA
ncbi:translation elongation factor Ts [Schaalia sp. JY-X159]|jgi:elongation factor Ts|uniref:translation elongation factor Ts n=1 Tax=Schaalia sp. JY-X159 TaxID=2758575 RepID=UPI00165D535D|nr:translation elongation factor Ts [Schaalia sp. JY-X159]